MQESQTDMFVVRYAVAENMQINLLKPSGYFTYHQV